MHGRARSNYWQLRLTVSWDGSGKVHYSLSGKEEQDRWQDMRMIAGGDTTLGHEAQGTTDEGLELLNRIIEQWLLPRDQPTR